MVKWTLIISRSEYIIDMSHNKYLFIVFIITSVLLISCSSPTFIPLETTTQSNILMEGRYWRGFFEKSSDFELRLTNNSGSDIKNCILIFDNKYKHTIQGLHSLERGMIKDSLFRKGEQLTFQFNSDISNLTFFNVPNENYFPSTVSLEYGSMSILWKFK